MIWSRPVSADWRGRAHRAFAATLLLGMAGAPQAMRAQSLVSDAGWQNVNLAQYRQHLEALDSVVAGCQAQRKLKQAAPANDNACDPARVGADDRVGGVAPGDTQPREVRYDWLRSVLARAGEKSGPAPRITLGAVPGGGQPPPTVDALLGEALERLRSDEAQASGPAEAAPSYLAERQSLIKILSQPAYKSASQVSARERLAEWFYNELDKLLASLQRFGERAHWIVWTLEVLLLLGIGAGLVWIFIRIERSSRVRLIPEAAAAPGAPSAREWQLWLKDARDMAAQNHWREAIHFIYWASIARLESNAGPRRLWPADRARTPREYLGLVPAADERKQALTALTRSFERTWYGGRPAASADFDDALEQASSLGVGTE